MKRVKSKSNDSGSQVTKVLILYKTCEGITSIWDVFRSTYDITDRTGVRYRILMAVSVEMKIEEDTCYDVEVAHAAEIMGYFAIAMPGQLVRVPEGTPTPVCNHDGDADMNGMITAGDAQRTVMQMAR